MSRFAKKMWIIIIWAGLGLLLGMQLANPNKPSSPLPQQNISKATSNAPQEITVPLPQIDQNSGAGSYTITVQANPGQEQEQVEVPSYSDKTPQEILIPDRSKPTVDVLADKTGNLLQKASQESIRFVVSLFSSATE